MVRRREEELLDSVDSGKERAFVEDRGRGIRLVLRSVQLVGSKKKEVEYWEVRLIRERKLLRLDESDDDGEVEEVGEVRRGKC